LKLRYFGAGRPFRGRRFASGALGMYGRNMLRPRRRPCMLRRHRVSRARSGPVKKRRNCSGPSELNSPLDGESGHKKAETRGTTSAEAAWVGRVRRAKETEPAAEPEIPMVRAQAAPLRLPEKDRCAPGSEQGPRICPGSGTNAGRESLPRQPSRRLQARPVRGRKALRAALSLRLRRGRPGYRRYGNRSRDDRGTMAHCPAKREGPRAKAEERPLIRAPSTPEKPVPPCGAPSWLQA